MLNLKTTSNTSTQLLKKGVLLLSFFLFGFGAFASTISGSVIFDANNNGLRDGSDIELPAMLVELFIDANNNNIAESGELSSTQLTTKTGTFSFTSVNGKAIVRVKSTSLGTIAANRSELIVANGVNNTSANLFVIGQSPICYAIADNGGNGDEDDLVVYNRINGTALTVKTKVSSDKDIETMSINFNATLLYAMDGEHLSKYDYNTGNEVYKGSDIGTITYKNANGGNSTTNIDDCDGLAIAGVNELWVSETSAGGIIFKIDTNGNVINNVFGTGIHGVEIVLPSAIASCSQLDDIIFHPMNNKLYGVYTSCTTGNYLIEIPTTGASAGIVTNYKLIGLSGTNWSDIEGLTMTTNGRITGMTGANANPSSQDETHLEFDEATMNLLSSQKVASSSGDFESCDCFTRNSSPLTRFVVSGKVFDDPDGLTDGQVNGTGIQTVGGQQLYAYLTDAVGNIVEKTAVTSNGSYQFTSAVKNNAYNVVISTTNKNKGEQAPTTANLPGTYVANGESFGTNNAAGTGNEPGVANLQIKVTTGTSNVTNVNFGLTSPSSITLSGFVFDDGNGILDNQVNGNLVNNADGNQLYVNLYFYDGSNWVVSQNQAVGSDGSYTFGNINPQSYYVVLLDKAPRTLGSLYSGWGVLPDNWVHTGQYLGEGTSIDNAPENGYAYPAQIQNSSIDSINFGINKRPETTTFTTVLNPSPIYGTTRPLNSANGLAELSGSDLEDGTYASGASYVFTDFSQMEGNKLFYDDNNNGVMDSGEEILVGDTISNYISSKLKINFVGNSTYFIFDYAAIDNAGYQDLTPAKYGAKWITPLPVELISFDANKLGANDAILKWSTASELNNDRFEIYKSLNGIDNFEYVASVAGFGNSQEIRNYSFVDVNANSTNAANVCYKLKQVDYDGKFEWTAPRCVIWETVKEIKVYPNPCKDYTTVNVGANTQGATISIQALDGAVVEMIELPAGNSTYQILTSNLRNGFYLITVEQDRKVSTQRLLVSH